MRLLGRLFLWGMLLFLGAAAVIVATARPFGVPLIAERETGDGRLVVEVSAERMNVYNRAWDGVGQVGGLLGPLLPNIAIESPPDLLLCALQANRTQCYANGKGGEVQSYCHDAYACKWAIDVDPERPLVLAVFDLDIVAGRNVSDFVDAISVNPGPETPEIEKRARALIEEIAPTRLAMLGLGLTWRPGEAARRSRILPQALPAYCAGGCELGQSVFTIE